MSWKDRAVPIGAPAGGGWRARATSVSPPSAAAEPGLMEAIVRGGAQGETLGYGDELSALENVAKTRGGVALAQALSGRPGDALRALVKPGALDEYRKGRDQIRGENEAARKAHPKWYIGGGIAGSIATAPLLPGGQAKGLKELMKVGAITGGAAGLGGSNSDLTSGDIGDMGGALLDTGVGAASGAAAGAAAHFLPMLVSPVARKGAELLRRLGITQGRKVLTGGTKSISQAAAVSDDAVTRALEEGAIRPGGTTAGAAERLGVLREGAGEEYARIVAALEAAGVKGPQRDALARALFDESGAAAANSAGSSVPGYLKGIAEDVAGLPAQRVPGETQAIRGDVGEMIGAPVERLGLRQAENVKRSLQDAARKEYTKVGGNTELGEAKMAAAARLRAAVEDAISSQSGKAPAEAAAFEPVKKRLSELIQGGNAADRAANSALNKNSISLRDLLVANAGKDPATKLALLPLSMVARATGPSTVAAGAYGAGRALEGLAGTAGGARLTQANRTALQALLDELRRKEETNAP